LKPIGELRTEAEEDRRRSDSVEPSGENLISDEVPDQYDNEEESKPTKSVSQSVISLSVTQSDS